VHTAAVAIAGTHRAGRWIMRRTRLGLLIAALVISTHATAFAQVEFSDRSDRKDLQIANDVVNRVNRYALLTIFDDINAQVSSGIVTLTGKVTMPYKSSDIEKQVGGIAGVTRVVNRIGVLPMSKFDDDLRYRIARAIYGNANFWNYAAMANPPIHIVVDRGRVTLTGVVQSEVDRALARSLATQFGAFSIRNELRTDADVREQREKS
jgi:hyperosmotically inducible protein